MSSGAVGAGIGQLGLARRPENLRQLQAAAAIGQAYLIRAYDEGLRRHGRHAAQLLLTHEDFDSRSRYLNMRNTLTALFEWDAVPIINENDTISVAEIKFGDNDRLAAMVTNLLQAPLLVILSVVDGLYRTDPGSGTAVAAAAVVPLVPHLDEAILALAGPSRSAGGTGGMRSKLEAARLVTHAGGSVVIASGTQSRAADPDSRRRAGRHPVPGPGPDAGGPQALDRPDRPAAGSLRRRRRRPPRAGDRLEELARHRHRLGGRRVRERRRGRHPRRRGPRVRPRSDELRRQTRPTRSAACGPSRPARPWAPPSTTRSCTRTTWS